MLLSEGSTLGLLFWVKHQRNDIISEITLGSPEEGEKAYEGVLFWEVLSL